MANAFKSYTTALDGTLQTVLTVPASTTVVVIGLRVANKDGTNSAGVDLFVTKSAVNYSYAGINTPIPPGSSLEVLGGAKLVLEATDLIKAQASATGDLDIVISVLEIT